MHLNFLTIAVFVVLGTGCAGTQDKTEFLNYRCESGEQFKVAYFPSKESATLRLADQSYSLVQIPSGSGARYILDDKSAEKKAITLYTKGVEARLELGQSIYKNCKTGSY
ncbi:MliC family protein [Vibrio japonicus]|uniref:MliC family protein n=1 Tax=Vibrio japonicus TaxID=1824638 RepID=A0ABY5LGM6_9VIBR|nr:MliC family protein [Vibrio japonicus]UUM31199.1 MliC family protein [Vibrio japonicus]